MLCTHELCNRNTAAQAKTITNIAPACVLVPFTMECLYVMLKVSFLLFILFYFIGFWPKNIFLAKMQSRVTMQQRHLAACLLEMYIKIQRNIRCYFNNNWNLNAIIKETTVIQKEMHLAVLQTWLGQEGKEDEESGRGWGRLRARQLGKEEV